MYLSIDDVSVTANANPGIQLLNNPGFENSSSSAVGWTPWCRSTCTAGILGNVSSLGCRTSICFISGCGGAGAEEYLGQTFPATIGQTYNISFWFQRIKYNNSAVVTARLYAGII